MTAGEVCGNGTVEVGEDCDDGNEVSGDGCDSCVIERRIVFVSSGMYSGNLSGLGGADSKCQDLAKKSRQPKLAGRKFAAWLSTNATSAASRIDLKFTGIYELVDGTEVAKGSAGLMTGQMLSNAINADENGGVLDEDIVVWTNTKPDGESLKANDCQGWANNELNRTGAAGVISKVIPGWTISATLTCNNDQARIYCFEVPKQ